MTTRGLALRRVPTLTFDLLTSNKILPTSSSPAAEIDSKSSSSEALIQQHPFSDLACDIQSGIRPILRCQVTIQITKCSFISQQLSSPLSSGSNPEPAVNLSAQDLSLFQLFSSLVPPLSRTDYLVNELARS